MLKCQRKKNEQLIEIKKVIKISSESDWREKTKPAAIKTFKEREKTYKMDNVSKHNKN